MKPLPRPTGAEGKREKRTEPMNYRELDPWREVLMSSLRLQATEAEREVAETKTEAIAVKNQARVESAGADLLSANLAEVQDLLLSAGLGRLCEKSIARSTTRWSSLLRRPCKLLRRPGCCVMRPG